MRRAGRVAGNDVPSFLERFRRGFVKDVNVDREDVQQASITFDNEDQGTTYVRVDDDELSI